VGDFIQYTVNVTAGGDYNVKIGVKKYNSRGIFQLYVDGVMLGTTKDSYATSEVCEEFDIGNINFGTAGNKLIKLVVTGKNASSSGYSLGTDYIKLTSLQGGTPLSFSGIYPHLAVFNSSDECGMGAVVPWAGKLWTITYPPHVYGTGDDKLYEIDTNLNRVTRIESVGGTHACRMIHTESNQLIIGCYFIDASGNVRAVSRTTMPGRLTAVARHLTDPANKVYFYTMEEGLYEVNVNTLQVTELHKDTNVGGTSLLPGVHGKGAYSGQGRLVVANNGTGGVLAEWNGTGDPGQSASWTIVDANKYTDVTGPGGINGAPAGNSPLWALGWDSKSVKLKLLDNGTWYTYRLPKASYTYDADNGWFTEWPRIRQWDTGSYLMDMHGMFYSFPGAFSLAVSGGISPISSHLMMVADFAKWNNKLVLVCDDASKLDNPYVAKSNSNLRLIDYTSLAGFGRCTGNGGPWINESVTAGQASEPYLLTNLAKRVIHFSHTTSSQVTFTIEVDQTGNNSWTQFNTVNVPANGYAYYIVPSNLTAQWIRFKTNINATGVTAFLNYSSAPSPADPNLFSGLANLSVRGPRSEGILKIQGEKLQYVASRVDQNGNLLGKDYYEIGEDMNLTQVDNPTEMNNIITNYSVVKSFSVDSASVIVTDGAGKKYRLPKGGNSLYEQAWATGWAKDKREVVTERSLMNIHGTFYELPRDTSGGLMTIKPICTHNKMIYDFASWRGMLVLAGVLDNTAPGGPIVKCAANEVRLWFGNVDDLWKLGAPSGSGGPWQNTVVTAGQYSDQYLMAGYNNKSLQLSHNSGSAVIFTVEVDYAAKGTWSKYADFTVNSGTVFTYNFPDGYNAHWVRVKTNTNTTASATFTYSN
jgi:hypothetical protein